MRAVVQNTYGTADVLRLAQIADPQPDREPGAPAGARGGSRSRRVAPDDRQAVRRFGSFFGFTKPKNPVAGQEVAGTVVAVGAAVTRFAVGDEVFGIARGAFAEYAVAREEKLAIKPANVTFEQAAVAAISALTALQALRDVGRVQPGQKVLIVGASGGVGSYAVQLAKAFGAEVTAVCSTAKLDLVRSLGADHVIDYTRDDFADGTQRYDLILDIAGNPTVSTASACTHSEGDGGHGRWRRRWQPDRGSRPAVACARRLHVHSPAADGPALQGTFQRPRIPCRADRAGTITPSVGTTYPLDQVPQAMRDLEGGRVRGKIAIVV